MSSRRLLLLAAFFLSGLAALVFELVWTRLLLLSIGTTATAVGVVLAAFMGGMAIGSALAGCRVSDWRDHTDHAAVKPGARERSGDGGSSPFEGLLGRGETV